MDEILLAFHLPRFVRFEHSDAALRAIASMDGHRIGTKKLLCKLANSPKEKEAVPVSAGKTADDGSPRHRPAAHKGATSSGTHHHMLVSSPSMPNTATNAGIPSNYAGNTSTLNMASSSAMPQPVLRSSSTPNLPASYARAAIHLPRTPSTNLYLKGLLSGDTEGTCLRFTAENFTAQNSSPPVSSVERSSHPPHLPIAVGVDILSALAKETKWRARRRRLKTKQSPAFFRKTAGHFIGHSAALFSCSAVRRTAWHTLRQT